MQLRKNINPSLTYYLTILFLLVLNLFLKASYLASEPIWYDEAISIGSSLLDFGHVKHMSEWDNNPPFYYYCLWVWTRMFGITEFDARSLSVLFSTLTSVFIFTFTKKHLNYLTGLGSSLLFTFHNFSYEYSHEARAYSLVTFLVIVSSIFVFKLIEKPSYLNMFILGLFNFLIIYTHYIAGIILIIQLLFLLFSSRKTIKPFLIASAVTIILTIIRFTIKQFILITSFGKGETFWLRKADFHSLIEALQNLMGGKEIYLLFLLLLAGSFVLMFTKKNFEKTTQKTFLVYTFLTGVTTIIILFIIGTITPVFLSRYLLFTVPFICILISWTVCNINSWSALFVPVLLFIQLLNLRLNPTKPTDFRMAVEVVKKLSGPAKASILIQTGDVRGLFVYYYDREAFKDHKNRDNWMRSNNIYYFDNKDGFKEINLQNQKSFIFCQSFEEPDDSKRIFDIFKENKFEFATSNAVRGVRISLIKKL